MALKREAPESSEDAPGQQRERIHIERRVNHGGALNRTARLVVEGLPSTKSPDQFAEGPKENPRQSTLRTESKANGVTYVEKVQREQTITGETEGDFNDELSLTDDERERISKLPLSALPNSEMMETRTQRSDFLISYGNQISQGLEGGTLTFYRPKKKELQRHPTRTKFSPDIIVSRERKGGQDGTHWSNLESVGEACNSEDEELKYTTYLLQARPDLVVAFTFQVEKRGIVLIATDVSGTRYSPLLEWGSTILRDIFGAFIYRLYHPHPSMVDASICRVNFGEAGLFNVDLSRAKKDSTATYQISYVGSLFDGRKTIFKSVEHPETINNVKAIYVKEHYTSSSCSDECDVIEYIHENGDVPGVVKVLQHWQPLKFRGYKKFRLAEGDMGRRLMAARMPRELLTGIYDLLEITRYLYREKNVLHQDISEGNVFINSSNTEKCSIPVSELCCANYLLGNTEDPSALSIVLTDFNLSEILHQKTNADRSNRTGTPVFIARAVATGKAYMPHCEDVTWNVVFPLMPPVPSVSEDKYRTKLQNRVRQFVKAETTAAFQGASKETSPPEGKLYLKLAADLFKQHDITDARWPKWRHELRHDAESVFWLLVYWVVQALPANSTEDFRIPFDVWRSLTEHWGAGLKDLRGTLFDPHDPAFTHPRYSGLNPLVKELWTHISSDHHWAPEGILCHPEYVHEAFQRTILAFLSKGGEVLDEVMNPTMYREVQELYFYPQERGESETSSTGKSQSQQSSERSASTKSAESGASSDCSSTPFSSTILSSSPVLL